MIKGKLLSEEHKKKISRGLKLAFQNGLRPGNPSVKLNCAYCKKDFEVAYNRRNQKYCANPCAIKGRKGRPQSNRVASIKYIACHERVYKLRGAPSLCEVCGTSDAKKYDWANMTGNYSDVSDYKRMCRSCHVRYDKSKPKEIPGRRMYEQKFTHKMSAV